jgi:hypothetical protein
MIYGYVIYLDVVRASIVESDRKHSSKASGNSKMHMRFSKKP